MSEKKTRLTIYTSQNLKDRLKNLAEEARPPTSTTKFAAYLIELGLREYTDEKRQLEQTS